MLLPLNAGGIQPARYAYDQADRLTELTTWRADEATIETDPTERPGGDTTTWEYHDATGLLTRKTWADGSHQDTTYSPLNLIAAKTTARGIATTYLQIAALDLTRNNVPALWYLHWDPNEQVATRPLSLRKNGVWYTYGNLINITEDVQRDSLSSATPANTTTKTSASSIPKGH